MYVEVKKWINTILGLNIVGLVLMLTFLGKTALNIFLNMIFYADEYGVVYEDKMLLVFFVIQIICVIINFIIVLVLKRVEQEVMIGINKLHARISELEKK